METKEELLIYKSALEKLLQNIHRIDQEDVWGLCYIAIKVLRKKQLSLFKKEINKYGKSIGKRINDYLWFAGQREPRKQWLEQELEKVNQKIKEYEN